MIVQSGMGAPVARRSRKITLEPMVIEGKVPPKPGIPWVWIALGIAVLAGGAYLLRGKKGRGRRRPKAA